MQGDFSSLTVSGRGSSFCQNGGAHGQETPDRNDVFAAVGRVHFHTGADRCRRVSAGRQRDGQGEGEAKAAAATRRRRAAAAPRGFRVGRGRRGRRRVKGTRVFELSTIGGPWARRLAPRRAWIDDLPWDEPIEGA